MATKRRPKRISISDSVMAGLEKHAYSNLEAEVGGMLFGKIVDGQTKISGFIPALSASAEQISLTFTHEVWEEILREGSKQFPEDQIVGWYHTHPSFGLFLSEYDLFIQANFFSMKGQLALVIDPIAGKLGWFESAKDQAKLIFEEQTKTGPKSVRRDTKPATVKKPSPVLVAAISATVGLCLGAAVALANMPPNLTGTLESTRQEAEYFQQQSQFMSDLLGKIQSSPTLLYTVAKGDKIETVLLRFYGSLSARKAVQDANPGQDLSKLKAGVELRIPAPAGLAVEIEEPEPAASPTPSAEPTNPQQTPSATPTK
jgi:proteasome lid subunit RPN8/RPN11/phage tail protein X